MSGTARRLAVRYARTPAHGFVPAPHVVDEKVEPAVIVANAIEERGDVGIDSVIAAHGDAMSAAGRNLARRLIDGAWRSIAPGRSVDGPATEINRRARGAQFARDAAPGAAACTCNQSNHG
jgi:hypothetical protein